jgi:hypothetical protein
MIQENLNIHDHHKILAIKALDRSNTIKDAAKLIGITDRTLYRWIKIFKLKTNKV